ncbi:hypothetical protein SESBI_13183 [Sesbania bispinosa]|nr:hypothetical protein SESBI_13183 [Sesbania bispinosa]
MEEDNTIQISSTEGLEILLEAEGDSGIKAAQRMLVGRVMTEKTLNRAAVKEIEAKQAKKALDEGPWFVMGHLLSLQHWIPEAYVFEVNYDCAEFWIQLHNLPLEFMSDANGESSKVIRRHCND